MPSCRGGRGIEQGFGGLGLRGNQREEERLAAGSKKTKLGTQFEFRKVEVVHACNKFGDGVLEESLECTWYFISKIFRGAQIVIQKEQEKDLFK
jgi:hypothetical protein